MLSKQRFEVLGVGKGGVGLAVRLSSTLLNKRKMGKLSILLVKGERSSRVRLVSFAVESLTEAETSAKCHCGN